MSKCANPDCPWSGAVMMSSRWVQVQEIRLEQVGQDASAGVVKHEFAAVACSKRCAAAVLSAAADANEEPKGWGDRERLI